MYSLKGDPIIICPILLTLLSNISPMLLILKSSKRLLLLFAFRHLCNSEHNNVIIIMNKFTLMEYKSIQQEILDFSSFIT